MVGEQVWRGALLMADFILGSPGLFPPETRLLELGGGSGLTAIVAAAVVDRVVCSGKTRDGSGGGAGGPGPPKSRKI